jgi:hypothetical protein
LGNKVQKIRIDPGDPRVFGGFLELTGRANVRPVSRVACPNGSRDNGAAKARRELMDMTASRPDDKVDSLPQMGMA